MHAAADIEEPETLQGRLRRAIAGSLLPSYVYSYPSKRAYRAIEPARVLADAWSGSERRRRAGPSSASGALNLYVHVPFCGYRCSFCTLFLTTAHTPELVSNYVGALERQIEMYGQFIGHLEIASLYIGGGTPTTLNEAQFERIFTALHRAFPRWNAGAEISVEGSPDTMERALLASLARLGVNRVSMGLQTLDPEEQKRVGRPYAPEAVYRAVEAIDAAGFANVNYDLIYGLEGQQVESWLSSLAQTVRFGPQTVTLYPVVFRPQTVIQKRLEKHAGAFMPDASKYALYEESVRYLSARGFRQDSFVRFTTLERGGLRQETADFAGVPLLGLGAGARSYSDDVHYSTDFAVRRSTTLDIIHGFIDHRPSASEPLRLGFTLDEDEQKRRFCILNLSLGRLEPESYARRFGSGLEDFRAELDALAAEGCVETDAGGAFVLTPLGFKYSNVIGTLFKSARVHALEESYVPS